MKRTESTILKYDIKSALIQEEDGVFTVIETTKDGDEETNLTELLRELVGIDSLNITIQRKEVLEEE